jgi:hypothetical protein
MWYLCQGVTLTKDKLAKRNFHSNKMCCFYSRNEIIQHLFIYCHYANFHFCFDLKSPGNNNSYVWHMVVRGR